MSQSTHPTRRHRRVIACCLLLALMTTSCSVTTASESGRAGAPPEPQSLPSAVGSLALPAAVTPASVWPGGLTPALTVDVGAEVGRLHVEGDTLWAAVDGHAVNLDAKTGAQLTAFPIEPGLDTVAVSGEWLWASGEAAGVIVQYHLPRGVPGVRVESWMSADLVAAHGSVWASEHHTGNVARIDPATGERHDIAVVEPGRSGPQSLFADEEAVYVAVSRAKSVFRIDPVTEASTRLPGEVFACGGMDKVGRVIWGTGCFSGAWVAGFDTETRQPGGQVNLGDRYGESVAVVDDRLWASVSTETSTGGDVVVEVPGLALVDTQSRTVTRTVELVDGGGDTAFAGGRLWVVGRVTNQLMAFDSADLSRAAAG